MNQNAPGRTFLKVTGILCIIYGVFLVLSSAGSIFSYVQMTSGNLTDEVEALYEAMGISASALLISIIFAVAGAVIFLLAGILGTANSRKVEKAGLCMIFGILLIAFEVVNFGYAAMTTGVTGLSIVSTLISLVVPVLYLWGSLKNKEVLEGSEPQDGFGQEE